MTSFSATTPPTEAELERAASLTVKSESGEAVTLGSLYGEQKTICIFIRHFLCGLCQDYLTFLQGEVTPEQLEKAGVKLVIIGCGDWSVIKAYRELLDTPFPVYADSSMQTYVALGMNLRTLAQGDPKHTPEYVVRSTLANVLMSIRNAFKMGKFLGGPINVIGGEFVLGPGNTVTYTHRMENTKGHAPVSELLVAAGVRNA